MPRKPRAQIADVPQHVVQRGNNRQPTFFDERDRLRYLRWLGEAATERQCQIHAYVLMTNHVHLLVTPRLPTAISSMMQSLGRRYVLYLNRRLGRTGTLWEGRHGANLVSTEAYLLTCYRYIELNPVRAGIVGDPGLFRWSSFRCNALGRADPVVTEHSVYTGLGSDVPGRAKAYRKLFEVGIAAEDLERIRKGELHS